MTGTTSTAFALIVSLALPLALAAENIQGPVGGNFAVDSTSAAAEATVGIEDLVAISMGSNSRFIKGIELSVAVPPSARRYRDLLALYVYKQVSPFPSPQVGLYQGRRAGFVVLPASPRVYVNIPLRANAVEPSPETITLGNPIPADQFPLIVTVLPVAKGLPDSVSESKFTIKVSPIVENKGLLKLDISEDGKVPVLPYSLTIDRQQVIPDSAGFELPAGIHNLSITSNHYEEVNKTFGIGKGQTTMVEIALKRLVPTLIFEAPDTAQIFLDGQKLDPVPTKPLPVTEGSHTVIIRVGNYSLTKKFAVERGRSYKVSLFLDILVQEN